MLIWYLVARLYVFICMSVCDNRLEFYFKVYNVRVRPCKANSIYNMKYERVNWEAETRFIYIFIEIHLCLRGVV